jgi:peptide/histidine transporter 3/4
MWVQDNIGWTVGLGVLAGVLGVALAIFLLGTKKYRKEGPPGSPFTTVAQVFVAAARKWRVDETRIGWDVYRGDQSSGALPYGQPNARIFARTNQFRYYKLSTLFLGVSLAI